MYEVIAKDRKAVGLIPDFMVIDCYRGGYLRKATFENGVNGFKVVVPIQVTPFNGGMSLFLQEDYVILPGDLEGIL